MTRLRFSAILLIITPALCAQQQKAQPPKVILIGDSIRIGYAPLVAQRLAGQVEVISAEANGGDSANVLKNFDEWVVRAKPALVHVNCGLHDLKKAKKDGTYQVPLESYEKNLRELINRLRKDTQATIVFASTTPILDDRHAKRKAKFDRFEADVKRYNETAFRVMAELAVPVDDLHAVVTHRGAEKLLGADGTHYTPAGYEALSEAVANSVTRHLEIRQAAPWKMTGGGPKDTAAYQKAEAAGDALVPDYFKKIKAPEFPVPATEAAWDKQRPGVREKVLASLGDLPPRPAKPKVRTVSFEKHPGYRLEKVLLDNDAGNEISAVVLVPDGLTKPAPAVLWLHSSSQDTTGMLTPNRNGGEEPIGVALVKRGYVVLGPDNWWHGDRAGTGPAGSREKANEEQQSLHKLNLWLGRTLWGMFVRDDQVALDYLCARPEVNPKRIGATGMSMGSTRAWWLAAVDDRVACTVGVACLTRYTNLIAHGQLRQHGVYYFTYGLLKHFDTEGVMALIAPRPFLTLTGELDAGSPADGIAVIEEKVAGVYRAVGAKDKFASIRYPDTGHVYTTAMRDETFKWFNKWLKDQ
ncbi:MAG TPA: GDSL-type esterase/lipase family protein [Gemmataceae bacterium]|nr:GDSL-type esterase/lipase family protein [Gemmataceae bacterium]